MLRKIAAVALSVGLTLLPFQPVAYAANAGIVKGLVTIDGRPVSGLGLSLVGIDSGSIHNATSGADGSFEVALEPGSYVVTNLAQHGLSVGRAPSRVVVAAGRVAVVDVDLLTTPLPASPRQETQTAGSGDIIFDPIIDCVVEGEFPLFPASFEPMASVARARVYFKSVLGDEFYYVEMVQEGGQFVGKLPKPTLEASPITYYIQVTTIDFGESQTAEFDAVVVADESECDGEVAAVGPTGAVTVFSASTGAAIAPAGFAAGAAGLAAGTVALVVGGAAAIAAGTIAVVTESTPEPTPEPTPPPATPTPTPVPTTTTTTTTTTTLPPGSPFKD